MCLNIETNRLKHIYCNVLCVLDEPRVEDTVECDSIGQMSRVFSVLVDWSSIPSCVRPKTQKMVLDATLLNTQHYHIIFTNPFAQTGYDTRSIF